MSEGESGRRGNILSENSSGKFTAKKSLRLKKLTESYTQCVNLLLDPCEEQNPENKQTLAEEQVEKKRLFCFCPLLF